MAVLFKSTSLEKIYPPNTYREFTRAIKQAGIEREYDWLF